MITRIFAISRNTLIELVRQKVFYILLIFGLCAIGSSIFMAKLSFQEEFQMLKDVCLGAMSIFTSILAILATANFLPKDMEDRTIYTLLSKPVPRFAYLMGKLGGILILLGLFTLLMSAVFVLVLWLRETAVISEIQGQFQGVEASEEARAAIQSVRDSTFNVNLIPGISIIFVKAALLASMTLFVSTFATSALFTVMVSAAIYFIGHLQATAREHWMQGMASVEWWQTIMVGFVALMFPDLQAFNLTDDVIAGAMIPLTLFLQTFALGGVYVVVYFLLASFVFSIREL